MTIQPSEIATFDLAGALPNKSLMLCQPAEHAEIGAPGSAYKGGTVSRLSEQGTHRPPGGDETFDALYSFASIARELAEHRDPRSTDEQVVRLAVKVTGCEVAVLGEMHAGNLKFGASTDPDLAREVEQIIGGTDAGVSVEAARLRRTVVCNDLTGETRWPAATVQALARTDLRSAVAFYLELDGEGFGVLTLASHEAGYFTESMIRLASVYADHATIALAMTRHHDRAENLATALQSNREIGAAIGILIHQYGIDDQAAFDALRMASQNSNRKLRDIAAHLIADRHAGLVETLIRQRHTPTHTGQPTPPGR